MSLNRLAATGLFLAALCFSACGKESAKEPASSEASPLTSEAREEFNEIFDITSAAEENEEILGAYFYGLTNSDEVKKEIGMSLDGLHLEIVHNNIGGKAGIGWLTFIDGIPQKLSLEGKENYMSVMTVEKEMETKICMAIDPRIDAAKTIHRFDIACIFEPGYTPEEDNPTYGVYGSELPLLPYEIIGDCEIAKTTSVDTYGETCEIPEFVLARYSKQNRDGTTDSRIEKSDLITELSAKEELLQEAISCEGSFEAELLLCGKLNETYRITAFLNNEPCEVFGGKSTVDASVVSGKLTKLSIKIEGADFSPGYNTLFFMLIPISEENRDMDLILTKTKPYAVKKEK